MLQRQQLVTNWWTQISEQLNFETTTALKCLVRPFYQIPLRCLDFLEDNIYELFTLIMVQWDKRTRIS